MKQTVGSITAGTEIKSSMTLREIIYKLLYGNGDVPVVTEVTYYYGASDEVPTTLAGLTSATVYESDLLAGIKPKIFCGHGEGAAAVGQYPVIALPSDYKITTWATAGFPYPMEFNCNEIVGYNIYYLLDKVDDILDGGTTYDIAIAKK